MTVKEIIHARRDDIFRIAARHGVSNIRVFGSVAREQEKNSSDVDLLIDVTGTPSAWFPVGLIRELEEL
jgi:predicted nucleotidyltransferase